MAEMRTKVDALKDLGEKVTGATLVADENETIVGMIDKIADNYSGGGSGGGQNIAILPIVLEEESSYITIEDETTIKELEKVRDYYIATGIPPQIFYGDDQTFVLYTTTVNGVDDVGRITIEAYELGNGYYTIKASLSQEKIVWKYKFLADEE